MSRRVGTRNSLSLALAALAAAALGAGCSGGSSQLGTSSLSQAQFIERAESICSRGRRDAIRYQPISEDETETEAIASTIETSILPSIAGTIDSINELGAPTDARQQAEELLGALTRAVERTEELDAPTIAKFAQIFAPSGRVARKAGLFACAYG